MKTYHLFLHKRGTKESVVKNVKARTRNAAKNKVPKSLVLDRVRLQGGRSRTVDQRIAAGASKHRKHYNRVAFGV